MRPPKRARIDENANKLSTPNTSNLYLTNNDFEVDDSTSAKLEDLHRRVQKLVQMPSDKKAFLNSVEDVVKGKHKI